LGRSFFPQHGLATTGPAGGGFSPSSLQGRSHRGNELEERFGEEPAIERTDLRDRPVREASANPLLEVTLALRAQGKPDLGRFTVLQHTGLSDECPKDGRAHRSGAVRSTGVSPYG